MIIHLRRFLLSLQLDISELSLASQVIRVIRVIRLNESLFVVARCPLQIKFPIVQRG